MEVNVNEQKTNSLQTASTEANVTSTLVQSLAIKFPRCINY